MKVSIFMVCFLVIMTSDIYGLDFFPRLYDSEGEIEINFLYDKEQNKTDGSGLERRDIFLKEKLTLYLRGYIYHPRFITIYLKTSGGLKHEDFRTDRARSSWWTASSFEYEWRNFILPEHPYNLEIFLIRKEPLSRQGLLRISPAVSTIDGARFKYEKKPIFLNMLYSEITTRHEDIRYDTRLFNSSLRYFKDFRGGRNFSLGGSYFKSDSLQIGSRDQYQVQNGLGLNFLNLYSSASFDKSGHEDYGRQDIDSFNWTERLSIRLPLNFSSGLSYMYTKNKIASSDNNSRTSEINNGAFSLNHQLFSSLSSTYRFNYLSTSSNEDKPFKDSKMEVKTYSHFLSSNYTKSIRIGRLNAGFNWSSSISDRKGRLSVIKEAHSAQPGIIGNDEFDLNERDAIPESIDIYVENPDNRILYRLIRDVHFLIIPIGDIVRIRIIDLPSGAWSSDPNIITYNFFVSYESEDIGAKLKTEGFGYYLRLDLYDNLFSPYYTHQQFRTSLVSGRYEGRLPDTDIDIVGFQITKRPYFFTAQFQKVSSNLNPSDNIRAEGKYVTDIGSTANITSKLFYSKTWYFKGYMLPEEFTEIVKGFGVDLRKRFGGNLLFLGGLKYSRRDSRSDSDAFSINSSVIFRAGRFEMAGGVNIQWYKTESLSRDTRRFSELLYVNLKRRF